MLKGVPAVAAATLLLAGCMGLGSRPPTGAAAPAPMAGSEIMPSVFAERLKGERGARFLSAADRDIALAAEFRTLEYGRPGVPLAWRSTVDDAYGQVVAGEGYVVNTLDCRPYVHTMTIGGRTHSFSARACRQLDGSWHVTS